MLVFAHHLDVLDAIESQLTSKKISSVRIDGGVSDTRRREAVRKFQEEEEDTRVAVLSISAAGVSHVASLADSACSFIPVKPVKVA